jgi:hypothetical protein
MTTKYSSVFLYLALACFLGIILIFIFDGYIGVYDSLVMDNGQYKETVEGDQWAQQEKYRSTVSMGVDRNSQVDFTYTIENHRFSAYSDSVDVSLWYNKSKTADLLSRQLSIPAFDKQELKWTINAAELVPANYTTEQNFIFNIKIKRGDIEREINVNVHGSSTIIKTIPAPVPEPVR